MNDPATAGIGSGAISPSTNTARAAIARAAERTGVDFGYLLAQAKVESGLNPEAKAQSSSASGLFQFIESTWMRLAQKHGLPGGTIDASNPASRAATLALRNDPQIASHMAAELARENSNLLTPAIGRAPDASELYLAHFLGAGEAVRFLDALREDPTALAAPLFAKQAEANSSIFFAPGGGSRSLAEVMGALRNRIEGAMPPSPAKIAGDSPAQLPRGTPTLALASAPALPPFRSGKQTSLSQVLETQFAVSDRSLSIHSSSDHARRAYHRLKAFGL